MFYHGKKFLSNFWNRPGEITPFPKTHQNINEQILDTSRDLKKMSETYGVDLDSMCIVRGHHMSDIIIYTGYPCSRPHGMTEFCFFVVAIFDLES